MRICVVGAGYVGLVAAASFSDMGHQVYCVDNNNEKLLLLNNGIVPIFEPGLNEMIKSSLLMGRLIFTKNISYAVKNSEICFIAVGTPSKSDGSPNLDSVFAVAEDIARSIDGYKVIVNKSTCPVGTTKKIEKIISRFTKYDFDVVSNPEFLKQGKALNDFLHPDRTIIGSNSKKAIKIIRDLYSSFYRTDNKIIVMDPESAEMTKYAANAFLATKISFINEITNLCEKVGADAEMVREGLVCDDRIGDKFLFPGIGYGGSCFPKDVSALIDLGKKNKCEMPLVSATEQINSVRPYMLVDKIKNFFNDKLTEKTITIWGLSFKPNTNDMRNSPAIEVINELLKYKCKIVAYDPKASSEAFKIFSNKIKIADSPYKALENSDCLVVLTEWNEFKKINFQLAKKNLKNYVIFDGRNIYDPLEMKKRGFKYFCFGRPAINN